MAQVCLGIVGDDQTAPELQRFVEVCLDVRTRNPHQQLSGSDFVKTLALPISQNHTSVVVGAGVLPYPLLFPFLGDPELRAFSSISSTIYQQQTIHISMPISGRFLLGYLRDSSLPSCPVTYQTLVVSRVVVYLDSGNRGADHAWQAHKEEIRQVLANNRRFARLVVTHCTVRVTRYFRPRYRRRVIFCGHSNMVSAGTLGGTYDRVNGGWSETRSRAVDLLL